MSQFANEYDLVDGVAMHLENPDYLELLRKQCVFDYCEINLPYLEESYSFNTPPLYSDFKPKSNKEYDFVFIGSRGIAAKQL